MTQTKDTFALGITINGIFCGYLVGKKKSYSKFRKFDFITSKDVEYALKFNTEGDAIEYRQNSPLTLNYYPIKIK